VSVDLSLLSFGGAPIGNLYRETSEESALAAVRAAWDAGIRYFDTAPHYGLGLSERRLGRALRGLPRDEYVISTKVGRLLEPASQALTDDEGFAVRVPLRRRWDFSRDGILRSVEGSLSRLGADRVDILFLHDPDDHWEDAVGTGYPALAELRSQRIVAAIGAGMNQAEMLTRFVRETDMDLVMLAGRYTLLEQGALDELLPLCAERRVRVVAAGVFNSGLLSREQPPAGAKYNYSKAPGDLVELARRIAAVCERHGTTLPAAALRFPLGHPAVASVVVGMRDPAQVARNASLFSRAVPRGVWDELRELGLLRPDAPVPASV
jgi:D-threo-aldose 1-dehydrogenase